MSYEELHALRERRGFANRDARSPLITRWPGTDQIGGKRARGDAEAGSFAAKKSLLMVALEPAFVADKQMVKQHGQWWDPVVEQTWGLPPGGPVDGFDAAISA